MKRTLFWTFISFFTFILGVAIAFVWLDRSEPANAKFEATSPQKIDISTEETILPYCELANNPEKYDGKIVRVKAKLWFMIHGYSFLNKNCEGERKQTAVIFPDNELGVEIRNKIVKDVGLTEYNPWNFPDIIAVGKFTRVEPSRKSDSLSANTYLHFEILDVEKASK